MSVVGDIEHALVAHWSMFSRWRGGALRDEGGLLQVESEITRLPYNAVLRTRLSTERGADRAIAAALDRCRERGTELLWFVHPSATPIDLGDRLAAHGLEAVETATCMALDLAAWEAPAGSPTDVVVREVAGAADVAAYAEMTASYWEVPEHERPLVAELHRGWDAAAGRRHLAFLDGTAVGKGYLSFAGPPGVAAIFGMSVVEHARGRGAATALTAALLRQAKARGARRVVLHASDAAVSLYRRAGFVEHCALPIFATGPLWPAAHAATARGGTSHG